MDHQGRIARDKKGNPVAVPFDAAAPPFRFDAPANIGGGG